MRCPSCGNLNRSDARFCDACGTALEAPAQQPAPDQSRPDREAIGRYRIEAFLGRSGRKRVYKARDPEAADRELAIAVFETEGIEETVLARARRETQAM